MGLALLIDDLLGTPPDVGVVAYDGSATLHDQDRARILIRSPRALAAIVACPNELGVVRAYVRGDLDIDGDVAAVLHLDLDLPLRSLPGRLSGLVRQLGPEVWRELRHLPPPPPEEHRSHRAALHSRQRDAAAISHHYDVSNEFYELVLGPSMTYSCAVFADAQESLEVAQRRKLELIFAKLGLEPGMRLLDVGCGWGELLIQAARNHGARGVGITISEQQAELAAKRVALAGVADEVEIRLQDYRDIDDEPFDAIASVGMFEHVGRAGLEAYTRRLFALLAPGGRLLNHAIGRPWVADREQPLVGWPAAVRRVRVALGSAVPSRIDSHLMKRYVFPDGELHEVGGVISMLHETGFEVRHLESLREHYALTLRRWSANLDANWVEACEQAGERRARVWRLYMMACAAGFDRHSIEVHQVLAVRPDGGRLSHMPLRPHFEPAELAV